jgi:hypothetical protein
VVAEAARQRRTEKDRWASLLLVGEGRVENAQGILGDLSLDRVKRGRRGEFLLGEKDNEDKRNEGRF